MKIAVCVKQVPSTNKVEMDPITNTIIRDGKSAVINPYDLFALEVAISLKERYGATVTVFSMGIPATENILRDCVARGADEAILLSDLAFAGADTLATSYALAKGMDAAGQFDLILCGQMAIDGDTAQTGPELAATIGIPHVAGVFEVVELTAELITIKRSSGNFVDLLAVSLPALLTTDKDINHPRMPTIAGIRHSLGDVFTLKSAADIKADTTKTGIAGSPTQVFETFVPQSDRVAKAIKGDLAAQVNQLVTLIKGVTE